MNYLYNDQQLKIKRRYLRNNMSKPEQILWYYLRSKNLKSYKFRRQFSIDKFIVDFFCPQLKLGIEIDGDSHFKDDKAKIYDEKRTALLTKYGVKVLRFTNQEIIDNLDSVIERILTYLP